MEIRRAQPGDAEAIARVHVSTWQSAYRGMLPDGFLDGLRPEDRYARWAAALSVPEDADGCIRIAVDNGTQVRGFVTWGPVRDADLDAAACDEVYAIYVDPTAWRTGVGTALMGAVPTDRDVVLWLLDGNERAATFYRRCGFHTDGATRGREIGGADVRELRMRRSAGGG